MDYIFDKGIKLYVEDNNVNCSFRVSDTCSKVFTFTVAEFQYIVDHWVFGVSGLETEDAGRVWWEFRSHGPRPDCIPMEFVAISLQGWNFRFSIDEMKDAVEQFTSQSS